MSKRKKSKIKPLDLITPYTKRGGWECDFTLSGVMRFLKQQEDEREYICDYDPDFQRGHVWTPKQQHDWMVHYIRGGDSGRRLFFNHPGWQGDYGSGSLELVDGKQRIEAIRAFLADEVSVWGHTYSEFCVTDTDRRLFMGLNTVRINVNNLPTRAAVLQWYLEMNDGGTPHTSEELQKVRYMLEAN